MRLDPELLTPRVPLPTAPGQASMTLIRGGVVYDFPNTGDVLAAHQHDEGSQHLTAVLAGSFRHTYGAVDEILRAGEIIASPIGVDHTIEAMEPGGRILNVGTPG